MNCRIILFTVHPQNLDALHIEFTHKGEHVSVLSEKYIMNLGWKSESSSKSSHWKGKKLETGIEK